MFWHKTVVVCDAFVTCACMCNIVFTKKHAKIFFMQLLLNLLFLFPAVEHGVMNTHGGYEHTRWESLHKFSIRFGWGWNWSRISQPKGCVSFSREFPPPWSARKSGGAIWYVGDRIKQATGGHSQVLLLQVTSSTFLTELSVCSLNVWRHKIQ